MNLVSLQLKGDTESESVDYEQIWVVLKFHHKFTSCGMSVTYLLLIIAARKEDQVAKVKSVCSFESQTAQILRLRRLLDVEPQKPNALQADVLRRGAENLQFS